MKTKLITGMKKHFVIILSALILCCLSCEKDNNDTTSDGTEDIKYGVLKGKVGLYEGDCIPISSCQSTSFKTTVKITQLSDDFYSETYVDSVLTSDEGSYEISLPEGNYRLYIRDGNEFIDNYWLSNDDFNSPKFTIKQDSITTIDAFIDHRNGILRGKVGLYVGNCMPGPGIPPCEPTPISTTVAITEPSEFFNAELLVDYITSSENGIFEISLPEGYYSIFLKDGDDFVCVAYTFTNERYCTIYTVDNLHTTTAILNIDHANW
jgi:hypothetical protein